MLPYKSSSLACPGLRADETTTCNMQVGGWVGGWGQREGGAMSVEGRAAVALSVCGTCVHVWVDSHTQVPQGSPPTWSMDALASPPQPAPKPNCLHPLCSLPYTPLTGQPTHLVYHPLDLLLRLRGSDLQLQRPVVVLQAAGGQVLQQQVQQQVKM